MQKKILLFVLTTVFLSPASLDALPKKSKNDSAALTEFAAVKQFASLDCLRLVEIFKDLHQHPELGFMETRTAAIVNRSISTQILTCTKMPGQKVRNFHFTTTIPTSRST